MPIVPRAIRNLVSISQEKRALTCQVDNKSLKFEMVTHSNIGNVNLHLFGFKKRKNILSDFFFANLYKFA